MIEVTQIGLLHLQVCTDLSEGEVEAAVRAIEPCGTTDGWRLSDFHAPVECDTHPGRKHYILLA